MSGSWIGLFSGGKDSSWAVHRARERGLSIDRLLTVHPPEDSFMYHVPATDLASLAARAMGLPLDEVSATDTGGDGAPSGGDRNPSGRDQVPEAGTRGDRELEPLADALTALDDEGDDLRGVTVGAVASRYQADRVERVCEALGWSVFAPLWGCEPAATLRQMVDAGFEIRITAVAAAGLDASWLGRTLDADAVAELETLHDSHGVHPLGEGGEFETLVTAGPHMDRRIRFEATPHWDGTRGELRIDDAWLE